VAVTDRVAGGSENFWVQEVLRDVPKGGNREPGRGFKGDSSSGGGQGSDQLGVGTNVSRRLPDRKGSLVDQIRS